MSTGRRAVRGGLALGIGQLAGQGLSFLRNVIVARVLMPADFGIAATFAIAVALFDMASSFEPGTLLVQAPDGDDERFEAAAHSIEAARGVLNAILLLLCAWPLSHLFKIPQTQWAFYTLALVPVFRGLGHLDRTRMQRDLNFTPYVLVDTITSIVMVSVAWPLAVWLKDYSAMLWLLIGHSAAVCVMSHLVAERRYRLGFDRVYLRRIVEFGWPLLINGILIFAMMQGDRAIVGAKYSMKDLGLYSVGLTLTFMPSMLVLRAVGPLMLPLLSRVQDQPDKFNQRFHLTSLILTVLGIGLALPFICAGGQIVTLIFGSKYAAAGSFVAWLGIAQALRFVRGAPTMATMALGDTQNQMVSNLSRGSGVVAALIVAWYGGSLEGIALCAILGEVVALAVSLLRLRARHAVPLRLCVLPIGYGTAACAAAGLTRVWHPEHRGTVAAVAIAISLMLVAMGGMLLTFSEFRSRIIDAINTPFWGRGNLEPVAAPEEL